MGRLIDIDVLFDYFGNDAIDEITRGNIEYFVSEKGIVEAIPKDQYEKRLKADLVAMLTEIELEIEELENPLDYDFEGYNQCAVDCEKLIQQKIDKLKEQTDGENNN